MMKRWKTAGIVLASALVMATVVGILPDAMAKKGSGLVMFTANWCANCRTVGPVLQEIGSQNGLGVYDIDVDAQDAPSKASNFGLSIPSADLPQVYYVDQGKVTLLFDSRQYKFAKPDIVRNQILSNLQQAKSN